MTKLLPILMALATAAGLLPAAAQVTVVASETNTVPVPGPSSSRPAAWAGAPWWVSGPTNDGLTLFDATVAPPSP